MGVLGAHCVQTESLGAYWVAFERLRTRVLEIE